MATKKTTSKKPVSRKKTVNRDERLKMVQRIYKLRDAVYKKFNNRWSNQYCKERFQNALNYMNKAATELGEMY